MNIRFSKKLIFISISILAIAGLVFAAEGESGLNLSWPDSPAGTSLSLDSGFEQFTKYIYEWGISIGVILALFALIRAGVEYMSSTGNPGKISEAKEKIKSAFLGILLLLGSYTILNTINPDLTNITLPSEGFDINQSFDVNYSTDENLPCAFAYAFNEKNFQGNLQQITNLNEVMAFGTTVSEEGKTRDFKIKSFIVYREKRTEGEGKAIDDQMCETMEQSENEADKRYCTGNYIVGGNCLLELYGPNNLFDMSKVYGDKVFSGGNMVPNIEVYLYNPEQELPYYALRTKE